MFDNVCCYCIHRACCFDHQENKKVGERGYFPAPCPSSFSHHPDRKVLSQVSFSEMCTCWSHCVRLSCFFGCCPFSSMHTSLSKCTLSKPLHLNSFAFALVLSGIMCLTVSYSYLTWRTAIKSISLNKVQPKPQQHIGYGLIPAAFTSNLFQPPDNLHSKKVSANYSSNMLPSQSPMCITFRISEDPSYNFGKTVLNGVLLKGIEMVSLWRGNSQWLQDNLHGLVLQAV